jgi:hypothetical protein
VNGESWTEVDRHTNTEDFQDSWETVSFTVSTPVECRFIRLTQTDKTHLRDDKLALCAVEFFGTLSEGIEKLIGQASEPSPGIAKSATPPPTPAKSLSKAEFPMTAPQSLEGIISYLTKKHGNVHEKGIVTITHREWLLNSTDDRHQWVCWDFREMRVRPTHYTIRGLLLKSWVVEGSLDGESWTEIDRQTDNQDFEGYWHTASFAVSKPAECRFIRWNAVSSFFNSNHKDFAFEFFGTLSE